MSWVSAIFSAVGRKALLWIGVVTAIMSLVATVWFKGKQAGRDEYAARQAKAKARAARQAKEVRDDVARADADDIRHRYDRWVRR